jgi:hypothetical protein
MCGVALAVRRVGPDRRSLATTTVVRLYTHKPLRRPADHYLPALPGAAWQAARGAPRFRKSGGQNYFASESFI